jgi:NAD(P)H-dependent nitrite reductase small subunit
MSAGSGAMVITDVDTTWVAVAPISRVPAERGVAALVGGDPVALFRIDDEVFAIDHVEPFTGAPVLARGLVGSVVDDSRGGADDTPDEPDNTVYVASPLHKQRFDLRTGECLDDSALRVRCWPVAVREGVVYVASEPVTGP